MFTVEVRLNTIAIMNIKTIPYECCDSYDETQDDYYVFKVPAGRWEISAEAPWYYPKRVRIDVHKNMSLRINLTRGARNSYLGMNKLRQSVVDELSRTFEMIGADEYPCPKTLKLEKSGVAMICASLNSSFESFEQRMLTTIKQSNLRSLSEWIFTPKYGYSRRYRTGFVLGKPEYGIAYLFVPGAASSGALVLVSVYNP